MAISRRTERLVPRMAAGVAAVIVALLFSGTSKARAVNVRHYRFDNGNYRVESDFVNPYSYPVELTATVLVRDNEHIVASQTFRLILRARERRHEVMTVSALVDFSRSMPWPSLLLGESSVSVRQSRAVSKFELEQVETAVGLNARVVDGNK